MASSLKILKTKLSASNLRRIEDIESTTTVFDETSIQQFSKFYSSEHGTFELSEIYKKFKKFF